jgi:methylated-DNA-protein-cysteine methyltransferase-like protein
MIIQQPPDPIAFQNMVWALVRKVPYGKVTTFGQIASMIPCPNGVDKAVYKRIAPRWVGAAMTNAFSEDAIHDVHKAGVPWQRVVTSQGQIAMKKDGMGYTKQMALLKAEGVTFDSRDRIDFDTYGWDGPDEELLNAHGLNPPLSLKRKGDDSGPQQLSLF